MLGMSFGSTLLLGGADFIVLLCCRRAFQKHLAPEMLLLPCANPAGVMVPLAGPVRSLRVCSLPISSTVQGSKLDSCWLCQLAALMFSLPVRLTVVIFGGYLCFRRLWDLPQRLGLLEWMLDKCKAGGRRKMQAGMGEDVWALSICLLTEN